MDIEEYFDTMELDDNQKQNRKDLAEDLQDAVIFLFALFKSYQEYSLTLDLIFIEMQFKNRLLEEVSKHIEIDEYIQEHISEIAKDVVNTTVSNINKDVVNTTVKKNDKENTIRQSRATNIAENEANSVYNYIEYKQAIDNGFKFKKWITEKDRHVRKTHSEVDENLIKIDDLFVVGESLMRFPKDDYYGASAKEIVNCRCTVEYF